jgi:hypothetical protein
MSLLNPFSTGSFFNWIVDVVTTEIEQWLCQNLRERVMHRTSESVFGALRVCADPFS